MWRPSGWKPGDEALRAAASANGVNDIEVERAYAFLRRFLIDNAVIGDRDVHAVERRFGRTDSTGQTYVRRLVEVAYVARPAVGRQTVQLCPQCRNVVAEAAPMCGTAGCAGGRPRQWPSMRWPIPLISPDPRYRSMPCTVAGSTVVNECTSNCLPYLGCEPHRPTSRRLSPGCAPSSAPTTVSRSLPDRSVATRAIVYPVSSLAYVIRSSTTSSTTPGTGRCASATGGGEVTTTSCRSPRPKYDERRYYAFRTWRPVSAASRAFSEPCVGVAVAQVGQHQQPAGRDPTVASSSGRRRRTLGSRNV